MYTGSGTLLPTPKPFRLSWPEVDGCIVLMVPIVHPSMYHDPDDPQGPLKAWPPAEAPIALTTLHRRSSLVAGQVAEHEALAAARHHRRVLRQLWPPRPLHRGRMTAARRLSARPAARLASAL